MIRVGFARSFFLPLCASYFRRRWRCMERARHVIMCFHPARPLLPHSVEAHLQESTRDGGIFLRIYGEALFVSGALKNAFIMSSTLHPNEMKNLLLRWNLSLNFALLSVSFLLGWMSRVSSWAKWLSVVRSQLSIKRSDSLMKNILSDGRFLAANR